MDASRTKATKHRAYPIGALVAMPGLPMVDALAVPFIAVDENDRIFWINVAAKRLLGLSTLRALGRHWSEVVRLHDGNNQIVNFTPSVLVDSKAAASTDNAVDPWLFAQRADGSNVPVQLSAASLARTGPGDAPRGIGVVLYDQSAAQRLVERLTHRCQHDDLTGLVNRGEFEKRLGAAVRSARNNGHVHALCFMDLNEFKAVNDRHGHQAGDEVLQHVANRFRTLIRERDTLARLGGDEFALLMEHCGVEHAVNTARLMRFTLKQSPLVWKESQVTVGISIGITSIDARSIDSRAVLSAADQACYAAKHEGYDSICVSTAQTPAGISSLRDKGQAH